MLIRRLRKLSQVCKVLPGLNLVHSTKNGYFDLCGNLPISPTALSSNSCNYSSFACACSSAGSYSSNRTSSVAINEAQDALYDYLQSTRGLNHIDAEHISKNSPNFLQHLMSKVKREKHIRQSLIRYLRYYPINEFEPFFESIGLKPFEFLPLLPSNLMFLSDDIQMLELFHVLCDYGIPRNTIGKVYKEAGTMFSPDSELLSSKLVSYENAGLSKSSVIKLVTICPKFLISGFDKYFLRLWEKLKNLGIDGDWVQAYLDEKNTYHWNRMLGTLDFVGSIGCGDVDLAKLLKTHSRFFFDDSGDQIYVVVGLLLKSGLTMNEVLGLLVCYPRVMAGEFAKNLWEAVHFLYEIGMEAEEVGKIVNSHIQVLGSTKLLKPDSAIVKLKMDRKMIRDMIREDPNELRRLALLSNRKRHLIVHLDARYLQEKTSFMLKLGFVENSEEIIKALRRCEGRGDQLQERFDCLVNSGLGFDAAAAAVRRAPDLLNQSRNLLKKKIDFLINSLGQPIESLTIFPTFLRFDIGRVGLRAKMFNWLKEKGVLRPTVALSSLVATSEKRFIKSYVCLHPKGLQEWPKGLQEWERLRRVSHQATKS